MKMGDSSQGIQDKNRLVQKLNFEKKSWNLSKRDGRNCQSGSRPLKEKDKLLFIAELLPYCLPRLKQLDATINQEPVKRIFPFGGYTNKDGKLVEVGDYAFFYDHPGGASRESVAAMFPPELKEGLKS